MTLLRDQPDFREAIVIASERLGLAPAFVEKDYWVTQVLRVLAARYPGGWVFKGGTSLSKGYQLIDRFSEDVDVLVTGSKDDSTRTREAQLLAMSEHVANDLGLDWQEARAPGRGRAAHRADVLRYPRLIEGLANVAVERRGVLLETGFGPGEWPCEMVTITPLLAAPLEIDPASHPDTDAFEVRALSPLRTLLEKLALLHDLATRYAQDPANADERCGRHYHDVQRLLAHRPTRDALKDRQQFARILTEMEHVSLAQYGGWTPRPDNGYADSPAFCPAAGSDLRKWLQQRYDDAAALMPSKVDDDWSAFPAVLKQIGQHAELI